MSNSSPGFQTTGRNGFHVTFANGWTVSVQFGAGNYCSNRDWQGDNPNDPLSAYKDKAPKSFNAEIAAWDASGKWHEFEHDSVAGWCSPEQVLAFMNEIAAKPALTLA